MCCLQKNSFSRLEFHLFNMLFVLTHQHLHAALTCDQISTGQSLVSWLHPSRNSSVILCMKKIKCEKTAASSKYTCILIQTQTWHFRQVLLWLNFSYASHDPCTSCKCTECVSPGWVFKVKWLNAYFKQWLIDRTVHYCNVVRCIMDHFRTWLKVLDPWFNQTGSSSEF